LVRQNKVIFLKFAFLIIKLFPLGNRGKVILGHELDKHSFLSPLFYLLNLNMLEESKEKIKEIALEEKKNKETFFLDEQRV